MTRFGGPMLVRVQGSTGMTVGSGLAENRAGQVTTQEAVVVWLRDARGSKGLGLV